MLCNVMYVYMFVWLYVSMYPCTSPLLPSISRKKHCFSSVFAKMMSKNTEFFQIFGKRMQEAQASKKAGRGNRAWDPCFATPGPRRLRLVERHQIAARRGPWGGAPPPPVAGKIRSYVACARGMIVSPKVVRAGGMFPSLMIRTHTHTRARAHARAQARTHARTHARTQTQAEREREKLRAQRALKQSVKQYTHTHTPSTLTQTKRPFSF